MDARVKPAHDGLHSPSVMAGLVAAIYVDAPSPASPPSLPGLPPQSMRHRR